MVDSKVNRAIPETKYPLSYREKDARALAEIIKRRESVCLVAMKKVGISSFVRFFFYHLKLKEEYFGKEKDKYLFFLCDLNDLLEIKPRAFWILIFKRFTEAVAESKTEGKIKEKIDKLFFQSISTLEPFFLFDSLKKAIEIFVSQTNLNLVLFLLRFDRLKDLFSQQFFANLQSLFDTARFRFSCVTTSVRPLKELHPDVFSRIHISTFAHSYFLKPVKIKEMEVLTDSFNLTKDYLPKISPKIKKEILSLGSGHNMLTRLIGISFSEKGRIGLSVNDLLGDERVVLTLEEIWENLNSKEQGFLNFLVKKEKMKEKKEEVNYLFATGILKENFKFFTPLFEEFILRKTKHPRREKEREFTKKENLFLDLLLKNKGKVCSRDEIMEAVWPEYKMSDDLAVSDWAIDRLVWRLRKKVKARQENYKIVTIRGRGHKMAT